MTHPNGQRTPRRAGVLAVLVVILSTAGWLRFTHLNWDEGQWIHPDEGHMRIIIGAIQMPARLSGYFDTRSSPLNPNNRGYDYSYGTLPLFAARALGEWLDEVCAAGTRAEGGPVARRLAEGLLAQSDGPCIGGSFVGGRSAEVGRALAALADLASVVVVFALARRLYGTAVGLLAAGLAALTAFSIQQAHFFTVDSAASFFTLLTAYFSVRAAGVDSQGGDRAAKRLPWTDYALAGLAVGCAAACKVSAGIAALFVVLAAVAALSGQRELRQPEGLVRLLLCLGLSGLCAFLAFRIGQPYAFEGPGLFGLKPNPLWLRRLAEISAEQSGRLDFPSGRQWANRTPIVFPWLNMTLWGMGLPLGIASWVGWAYVGFELLRNRRRAHLVPWLWTTLAFLYLGTRWVKTMRYFLPLYPLLVMFAAYALSRLVGRARSWLARLAGGTLVGLVVLGAACWAAAFISIYLRPHTRLAGSRWMYAHVPLGSAVANEHWDWGLPLRVDGHDPFGGMYRGIEMQHYDEDTEEKRQRLYEWLDEADYVVLASNRLYASIPRLPQRYPLTIAYYRALFAGQLGFELVADFTSYPQLGPFVFPDHECPFPLVEADYRYQDAPIEVRFPPAEEAFSVYDHPRVLIFRKTPSYSRAGVEAVLGAVDVSRAIRGLSPKQISAAPDLLEFPQQRWQEQQAGGTWSAMFDRGSLTNRWPGLAALAWWLVIAILGWAVFPILFVALPGLGDRGYGLARIVALAVLSYLTWLSASLHILPNTRATIVRFAVLMAVVGVGVAWLQRDRLRVFLRHQWRLVVSVEIGFALLYGFWIGVRLLNPDLWHPIVGGEKPMDMAYYNAVMKSTWFPPYNPWFSGTRINYYYYGFVIVGTFTKLMGTVPTIAYNLAVPLLAALTGLGAFSVAHNLFGGHRRGALLAGWLAPVFVVLLGNLGVVRLIRVSLIRLGGEPFPSTIPGYPEAVMMLRGAWQVLAHGAKLPLRIETWYWYPTRIIPAAPEEAGPITEFPAFTFLYADLHAHMVALPLTLVALAIAVNWVRDARPHWASLLLGGLTIGALYPTNTWDYPTYLGLGAAALLIGGWPALASRAGSARWSALKAVAGRLVLLTALSLILYVPYLRAYAAGYSSVELWRGTRTPPEFYLWIHGVFLFPLATRLLIELWRAARREGAQKVFFPGTVGLLVVAVLTLAMSVGGYPAALVIVPFAAITVTVLCLPRAPQGRRFLWLLVAAGALLSLAVEIAVLKGDISRMNTVFKFYLQVWVLFAVAAAVCVAWARERLRRWPGSWARVWWLGMLGLVTGGALFLPFGMRARAVDRMGRGTGLTLDGMAYMQQASVSDGDPALGEPREIPLAGDYAAIRWLQEHVEGSPVILEGLGYREYLWANRVSIYTGLPTVIGWRWHQVQQRAALPDELVDWRRMDVQEFYRTPDLGLAWEILQRYNVRYVYVGEYERAYSTPAGLAKFADLAASGALTLVYADRGVEIYEVSQIR